MCVPENLSLNCFEPAQVKSGWIYLIWIACLTGVLPACLAQKSVPQGKPNVIIILADDMGYGGLSCYDNPYFKTPEIDRLAAEGLLLRDFHSNGTVCSPTRAALMTGRYQHRLGCHVVINADRSHKDHDRGIPDNEWTLAEALKDGGYTTAIFGKWHLGYKPEFNPIRHGFDQFNGFISGNIDAHSHYDRVLVKDWWQNNQIKDEAGYHTDLITEHSLRFIRKNKDRPFFIYAAHGTPHDPHQARGSKVERGPGKGKFPESAEPRIRYTNNPKDENWLIKHFMLPLDEGVGRIRREIEQFGLAENTVIWFISDNGGTKGNHSISPQTRGGKASLYEGGHRVPGIVWAPGRIRSGSCSEFIMGMDIMPTTLAMAKIKPLPAIKLDGIDVGPALFDSKSLPERAVFWGKNSQGALRVGSWKLVKDELYNLKEDPKEKQNLAQRYPIRVSQMQTKREAIFEEAILESPYD